MPRNMLECILRNLHLCDNEQLDKYSNFSKLCPVINELNRRFLKFSFNGENKSIDESMIPYDGSHGRRQQINNKPIRAGYNIWVIAEAFGYVFQFEDIKV